MPTKRRSILRRRNFELSPFLQNQMSDAFPDSSLDDAIDPILEFNLTCPTLFPDIAKPLWKKHGPAIVEAWIGQHPGSRPNWWWIFGPGGPHIRARLGGSGHLQSEFLAYHQDFEYGIPTGWVNHFHEKHFPELRGKAIDPADPPAFESEAAYLQRHGLLTAEEKKILEKHPELLAPELIQPADDANDAAEPEIPPLDFLTAPSIEGKATDPDPDDDEIEIIWSQGLRIDEKTSRKGPAQTRRGRSVLAGIQKNGLFLD